MAQVPENLMAPQTLAAYVLVQDLYRFGVTDFLGETPADLSSMKKILPKQEKTIPEVVPKKQEVSFKKQTAKPKKEYREPASFLEGGALLDAPSCVAFQEGALPFVAFVAGQTTQAIPHPLEQKLWANMLKAIGFKEGEMPSFFVFYGAACGENPLPEAFKQSLKAHSLDVLTTQASRAKALFSIGAIPLQLLTGGAATQAGVRQGGQTYGGQKGCQWPLLTTYHLKALLRQPQLKRQAWADLLQLKEVLDHG